MNRCVSSRARVVFWGTHGRPELRSDRAAAVHRPGAGRDLCAVRDRAVADLRHADGGQLRPRRVLHGRRLCRALHAVARRQFLDLPGRGAAGRRPVRPCRRTRSDPAALRPRHRLSAAADLRPELRDGRTGAHRLRQDRLSVRHAGNPAGRRQHRRRLFSALSAVRDRRRPRSCCWRCGCSWRRPASA